MNSKHIALAIVAACIAQSAQSAQSDQAAHLIHDIPYGDQPRTQLDLYVPDGVENPPVLVFLHGGWWRSGDKSHLQQFGRIQSLLDAGIAIAALNYTYSSEKIWPAQIDDVMAGLAFVRNNGAAYGYDGSCMAIWGQSSGAHLALWAGLLAAENPDLDLAAVVSWSAPSDLYQLAADRVADAVPGENENFPEPTAQSRLIGSSVPDHKPLADAASPSTFIATMPADLPLPGFLLAHGTQDSVVSPLQSQRMYEILTAQAGAGDVELRLVEGAGHNDHMFAGETLYAAEFLSNHLTCQN